MCFAPAACEHRAFGDPAPLARQDGCFRTAQLKGHATPSTTCDLLQAFGRETILQFGKPHQTHKRPAGAAAKSWLVRERTGLPHPSGKAVCLALKRKGPFAPSSQSEEASAGLKPIKASCEKWSGGEWWKAGKCWLLWLGKTLLKKIKKREKLIPYGRQMKHKCKTGHYAVSVVRLPHWGLRSRVKTQCPWDLWRHPSALRQG